MQHTNQNSDSYFSKNPLLIIFNFAAVIGLLTSFAYFKAFHLVPLATNSDWLGHIVMFGLPIWIVLFTMLFTVGFLIKNPLNLFGIMGGIVAALVAFLMILIFSPNNLDQSVFKMIGFSKSSELVISEELCTVLNMVEAGSCVTHPDGAHVIKPVNFWRGEAICAIELSNGTRLSCKPDQILLETRSNS